MNASRMKNIIVLKDLPSNLIDEAIVILKNGSKIKHHVSGITEENYQEKTLDGNYETAIKEAEFIVADYMRKLEIPKRNMKTIKNINIQYKKLKIFSLILGATAILSVVIGMLK